MPCIAIPARSIITLDMKHSFSLAASYRRPARGEKRPGASAPGSSFKPNYNNDSNGCNDYSVEIR
jgi:hypothetical protein